MGRRKPNFPDDVEADVGGTYEDFADEGAPRFSKGFWLFQF